MSARGNSLIAKYVRRVGYLDLRSLALFRIATGVWILWDLFGRTEDFTLFYTEHGFHPVATINLIYSQALWSLHWLNDSYTFEVILFCIQAFCTLCYTIGFRTRIFTFLTWLFLISLQSRNELVNPGGDQVLRVLLWWCLWLPLGEYFSVDSRHRAAASQPRQLPKFFSVWGVGYIAQLMAMYWLVILSRYDASWWQEGNAIQHVLHLDFLVRAPGRLLANYPSITTLLTHSTMLIEAVGPFLILIPFRSSFFRSVAIFLFFSLHLSIAICMQISCFSAIMLCAWLPLTPSWWWSKNNHEESVGRSSGFSYLCLGYVLIYHTIVGLTLAHLIIPNPNYIKPFLWPARLVRMDQSWNLFAPGPLKDDFLLVVVGKLPNGTLVDVLRNTPLPGDQSFEWPVVAYPNERWRKFVVNLYRTKNESTLYSLGKALVYRWNMQHPPSERISEFKVLFASEASQFCPRCPLTKVEEVAHGGDSEDGE